MDIINENYTWNTEKDKMGMTKKERDEFKAEELEKEEKERNLMYLEDMRNRDDIEPEDDDRPMILPHMISKRTPNPLDALELQSQHSNSQSDDDDVK